MLSELVKDRENRALIAAECCLSLWIFWMNAHSHAAGGAGSLLHPNLFVALFSCVLVVVAPRLRLARTGVFGADIVALLLGLASTPVLWLGGEHGTPVWLAAFAATGCSMAWFQVRTVMRLLSRPLCTVFQIVLVTSFLYGILGWFFTLLSSAGSLVVGLLAPVALVVALRTLPLSAPHQPLKHYFAGSARELVLGPLAAICGLCFVYAAANILLKVDFGSFAYGAGFNAAVTACTYLVVLAVFALAYWMYVAKKHTVDFYTVLKVPVALLTAALIVAGVVGSGPAIQVLISPTVWIISAVFWVFLVDAVQHGEGCALRQVAFGVGMYALAYYLGRCFFYGVFLWTSGSVHALSQELCFLLLGALVAVVVLAFRLQDHVADLLFRDINNELGAGARSGEQEYELVCRAYAQAHGLSERETEVMFYVARGYSKPFIAEKLSISDNTVRTHTKRIYEKCGVHTRRELQEQIEDGVPAGR